MTEKTPEPPDNSVLTVQWLILTSVVIAAGSIGYWYFKTDQSLDEFITALSWGSLITIVVGGLASFGASVGASFSRFRKDPVKERRDNLARAQQAKPAAFGMIVSGILFLLITVSIEWIAENLGQS